MQGYGFERIRILQFLKYYHKNVYMNNKSLEPLVFKTSFNSVRKEKKGLGLVMLLTETIYLMFKLPVKVYVIVNGVGVAFLNVMLEISVRFQMSRIKLRPAHAAPHKSRRSTPSGVFVVTLREILVHK
ncbi:hypothetical protein OUZ56_012002 [Daphnia magna]|uniref:Uncharacterized protein n=1 Tax=Daphnia magna TaxID=35525 RepID=A0ABQ9Z226_9CRUS|nr:hypothetical protein OUZ56_012002 [Daphnia magna]